MKKILLLLVIFLTMLPIYVFASNDDFVSMNLEETLSDEQIEAVFSNYKETDEQIPIYLFRGAGCDFCRSFLSYLNSITDEYGKYFKLVSYDVWSNENNSILLDSVASFLGQDVTGVPYIVIGDKVFSGYAEHFNEDIKNEIVKLYESDDRYDVFEEMPEVILEQNVDVPNKLSVIPDYILIIINFIFATLGIVVVIIYVHLKNKKVLEKLDLIQQQVDAFSKKSRNLLKKESKNKI